MLNGLSDPGTPGWYILKTRLCCFSLESVHFYSTGKFTWLTQSWNSVFLWWAAAKIIDQFFQSSSYGFPVASLESFLCMRSSGVKDTSKAFNVDFGTSPLLFPPFSSLFFHNFCFSGTCHFCPLTPEVSKNIAGFVAVLYHLDCGSHAKVVYMWISCDVVLFFQE